MDPRERGERLQEVQRCVSRGEYQNGRRITTALLASDPDDAGALQWHAIILANQGLHDEAEESLRRIIKLKPDHFEAHHILARVLTMQRRTDDALATYDDMARLRPDSPLPAIGKADLLVLSGRPDEARAMLEAQQAHGKNAPEFELILGTIQEQAGKLEEAVAHAQKFAGAPGVSAGTNRQLFYLMGRTLDKLKRYDEAFNAFARGASYSDGVFNRANFAAFIDRVMAIFTRKNLKSMPKSSLDSDLPVFVTSMPRTGSTLIERIINAHSKMRGVGELDIIHQLAFAAPDHLKTQRPYPDCIETITRKGLDTLGRVYLDEVAHLTQGQERIADKTLQTWQHIGFVQMMLPESRVINVRRHPMDTCLSCFMAGLSPQSHPYAANVGDLAFYYQQYDRLMKHWADVASIELLEVQYEELVEEPERVSREIIEFCGMEWEDGCLQYHKKPDDLVLTLSYDQVRKPVYKTAVARWRNYEKQLAPLRAALGPLVPKD